MTAIRLPLSGDVTQVFNINLGESSDPETEKDAICKASYGMQLGRISDALVVLLRYVQVPPDDQLRPEEVHALRDLRRMLHDIADVKQKHGAKHILRP